VGLLAVLVGCASRVSRVAAPPRAARPALVASKAELVSRYNRLAAAVQSLNAEVKLKAVTGSPFVGVMKEYRQIDAYLLAERPAHIRVVGQAPVVSTDIFDLVSDGTTFRMYIPLKNQFLVGPAQGEEQGENALENLRPEPLVNSLFWPEIASDELVLMEEESEAEPPSRDYVLTTLRRVSGELAIDRRIWFDRSDLHVSRVKIFGPQGRLESDIRYAGWPPAGAAIAFPRTIALWLPHENYRLEIDVSHITLNVPIPAGRFQLEQPPGTELVKVGQKESAQ
jgi:outer membrane lipoprotein-sorting protein